MLTMQVNGQPCDPSNCLIVAPGAWTFSGSSFATGNVVDSTYSLQSIVPSGSGGAITVVVTADVGAGSVTAVQGGIGPFAGTAEVVNGSVVETLNLSVGASQSVGGDYLGTWVAIPPVVPPQPPVTPPCTTCPPPPPPDAPPVPLPGPAGLWLVLLAMGVMGIAARMAVKA